MKHTRRRSKKTISKKFGGGLLLFLSSISLIGVGFSSWVIGPLSSAQVDIQVNAESLGNILEFKSKGESAYFTKYGFFNPDESLTNTFTFKHSFTFKQSLAKSIGYIENGKANFKATFSNENTNSKFIALFQNEYVSLETKINYSGALTSSFNGAYSGNFVTSTINLSGISESPEETVELQTTISYVSSKSSEIETFFTSLKSSDNFSFSIDFEAVK